ncbi:MAG: primosomal protein N' [Acidobacteria bacterium]|nr:primosomal protein N' [Acidobacteriota bacterium]MCA1611268.1 primosomal protein N' [Acidobacteriota bacterium]
MSDAADPRPIVSVALPLPLRREFSYLVPPGLPPPAPGSRVRVPFGERALTGVVVSASGPPATGMREILEVLDADPVCPPDLLALARRTAQRFFASTGEVLRSALPARLPAPGALRYRITQKGALGRASGVEAAALEALASGESVRAADLPKGTADALRSLEERGWVRAVSAFRDRRARTETAYLLPAAGPAEDVRRSARGGQVLAWLEAIGRPATAAEIRLATGAGPAVLRTLALAGLVRSFPQALREEAPPILAARSPFRLTGEQDAAVMQLSAAIREKRYFPALLQGVTGSGKTEVYLRAIGQALGAGRGAIWLVPEIALTPVFARELKRQFGDRAALLHSALSERERGLAWDRVRKGDARAVIGPRSAIFAPVADPGVIVVDEEHDASYKQRESPRYDAREVAALRAKTAGAALLFGSATPSLEAYHASRQGRVARLLLTERVESRPLPDVTVVDLRREIPGPDEKGVPLFSRPLVERLRETFARGEQAILLQPRRGYAPFLLCRQCGHDFRCTRCSVARTVHDRGRHLVCHYCGERLERPLRCPECSGALLEAIGFGTERVGDRFAELFPDVPYAVLDRDSSRKRGAGAVVEDVLSGRVSCLIGTQMVAKGHDFPNVTAVGVLSADTMLNFPDFRSAEKTFQLVAQVAGRAGRGESKGTVHVQTFHPQHPAIQRAAEHDVDGFCAGELAFRRTFFYPPFCELAAILVSSPDRERAAEAASAIAAAAEGAPGLRLSGPAPAPLERLQGRWRHQVLLRAPDRKTLLAILESCVPERPPSGVQIAADVDPQDLM